MSIMVSRYEAHGALEIAPHNQQAYVLLTRVRLMDKREESSVTRYTNPSNTFIYPRLRRNISSI